jgi:hypothetical protein
MDLLVYIHPLIATLALALLAHTASFAVRARNHRRYRELFLVRHSYIAPTMYVVILVAWASGLISTWALRPAEEVAASGHFKVGSAFVVVLTLSAISSRWIENRTIRAIHPWIGALALLLSAAQAFFGLEMLP